MHILHPSFTQDSYTISVLLFVFQIDISIVFLRLQYDSQLGPDLSIVKVESIIPHPDRHRILEQEQVAADYQDNSSQHRSRTSECMELGQHGSAVRSNDGSTHKILDSMTELNEHIRYHTGNLIRMLPDNQQSNQQQSHPGESMSSVDHRGHPHKMNQQGQLCISIYRMPIIYSR